VDPAFAGQPLTITRPVGPDTTGRMANACFQCNGITAWDDSAGSAVCTSCGTLVDPSQSALTSQYEFLHEGTSYGDSWDISTRLRCRSSLSWALVDHGKEARESRNTVSTLLLLIFLFIDSCHLGHDTRIHRVPRSLP
jgi:hypothetical protein